MAFERGMRGATAASLAVHGAVGLWLVTRPPAPPAAGPAESVLTEVVFVEVEPTREPTPPTPDVAPAAEARVEEAARVVDAPEAERSRVRRAAPSSSAPAPGAVTPSPEVSPRPRDGVDSVAPPKSGGLAMRRFSPRVALGGVDAAVPGAEGAAESAGAGAGDGAVGGRPSWMPAPTAPAVSDGPRTYAEGDSLGAPSGAGSFTHDKPGYKATTLSDGRVILEDKPNVGIDHIGLGAGIGFTGHFDLSDWVERLAGNDPYVHEKLKYLDRTRDRRAKMIERHEREVRRDAAFRLRGHLRRLWNDRAQSPAQRRRQLFALWDECDVGHDGARGRAAAFARTTIEAFIRRRLPAGSEHAYTRDELARLNRKRTSSQPFAPYEPAQ